MSNVIGKPAPDFACEALKPDGSFGKVSLGDYKGKWLVLFFYPLDFTFVCPTEIIQYSDRVKEFNDIGCEVVAASIDSCFSHLAWTKQSRKEGGLGEMKIPILGDVTKKVSAAYNVLNDDGVAFRGVFIIDPKQNVRQITINDLPIGRNVDETLRLVQALQFVEKHGEVCPAGWKPGEKTMVADPEKSLEYFETVGGEEEEEVQSRLLPIKSKKDLDDLIASGKKVVVKFWAPWCSKCRMIAPKVEDLQSQYPGITVASFDTTAAELEALTAELGVKALPQFRFYQGGKEVGNKIMGYKVQPLAEAFKSLDSQ